MVAAACVVRGNDQVIALLSYNAFNAVQKRHKEIVMQVVEQKPNDSGLSGSQMPGRCMRDISELGHDFVQPIGYLERNWGVLVEITADRGHGDTCLPCHIIDCDGRGATSHFGVCNRLQ